MPVCFAFLSAAAAGRVKFFAVVVAFVSGVRREKLRYGEAYLSEGVAGILRIAGAFLAGHTEIVGGNKHLNITLKLNY